MIEVHLHGSLKSLHEGPIRIEAKTAAEAVEAISRQLKGFRPSFARGYRRIKVVDHETIESLYQPLTTNELHIVPQLNGGKKGGFIQVLIGAAMIAAAFLIPGLGAFGAMLMKAGALLILGGIASILAPAPSSETEQRSLYLGSPGNTVRIGTRIPILYGEFKVSGHFLSFDINATQTAAKA